MKNKIFLPDYPDESLAYGADTSRAFIYLGKCVQILAQSIALCTEKVLDKMDVKFKDIK